jgi:hypothetical protein
MSIADDALLIGHAREHRGDLPRDRGALSHGPGPGSNRLGSGPRRGPGDQYCAFQV